VKFKPFIDGHGSSSSNGLIQEALGATVSSNATHTSAPAIMGSEETSRQESTILERQLNGKEQEMIKVKVEMSEEIQQLNSELDAMGIVLKGKEKPIRRAKRRSKLRVYLP
jgi:hypothetical protein